MASRPARMSVERSWLQLHHRPEHSIHEGPFSNKFEWEEKGEVSESAALWRALPTCEPECVRASKGG